jgi:hypothetical protein
MDNQSLLHILQSEIKSLDDLLTSLQNESPIHQLDKDFALSKVRNLYDYLLQIDCGATPTSSKEPAHPHENDEANLLKKNPQTAPVTDKSKTPPQVKEFEVPTKKGEEQKDTHVTTDEKIEEAEEPTPHTPNEQQATEAPSFTKEETSTAEAYQEAKSEEIQSEQEHADEAPIIADKFTNKRFRHDDLANQNQKQDLSTKLQSKPINDINKAIGINDRFLFIRELFEGNKSHYHETVEILNNIDTFENALAFIQDEFDWDMEAPAAQKFVDLIRRKLQTQA